MSKNNTTLWLYASHNQVAVYMHVCPDLYSNEFILGSKLDACSKYEDIPVILCFREWVRQTDREHTVNSLLTTCEQMLSVAGFLKNYKVFVFGENLILSEEGHTLPKQHNSLLF